MQMNMRQLCFHKVASAASKGALWWDFVTAINSNCTMAKKEFNYECVLRIFLAMGGNDWVAGEMQLPSYGLDWDMMGCGTAIAMPTQLQSPAQGTHLTCVLTCVLQVARGVRHGMLACGSTRRRQGKRSGVEM